MARFISNSITNLLNGVSQQPDTIRLANQASIQENGNSDIVFGLTKRNPTQHITKLNSNTFENSKVHLINRDTTEQYICLINNGALEVFTVNGVSKSVVFASGSSSYLTSSSPISDFNLVTVADYTFVVNKSVTVLKDNTVSSIRPYEAIIYVKNGQYKTIYEIKINGSVVASYETLDNSASANASSITTTNIATELYNDLVANLSGYTIVRDGSIIYLSHATTDFTITGNDGLGGDGAVVLKDKTTNYEELPYKGYQDFHIEIIGDRGTEYDNYYVYWDGTAWVETVKKGLNDNLNTSTMPHVLIRTADGNFRFSPADGSSYTLGANTYQVPEWQPRKVGDEITAPDPTFVGKKINDIFFYRNRLGVLADENVVFSKASEFFTFYPETVTTILDDDVVDVAVSHNKVSLLKYAVPFNEELLLFSDQTQFLLRPEEVLSAKTISINQTTEYEIDTKTRPIGVGQNVYFGFKRGTFAGLREYFVSKDTDQKEALDITINIPKYIKGSFVDLQASPSENTILCFSDTVRNEIYVYQYYFDAQSKPLQRSWSKWVFPSECVFLGGGSIENKFYLIVKRADGTYLESINLKSSEVDTNLSFTVLLDRRVKISGTYNSIVNQTTFTLPYPDTNTKAVVLSGDWTAQQRGRNITILSQTSNTVVVSGNYTANDVYVGNTYNLKYRFSKIYVREQKAAGNTTSINTGRLQLKRMSVVYGDTGYFTVTLYPKARTTSVYKFTGQILGSSNFILGNPILESGEFKFPIQCRNTDVDIEINNDSYLPSNLISAEWEGVFSVLTERIIT